MIKRNYIITYGLDSERKHDALEKINNEFIDFFCRLGATRYKATPSTYIVTSTRSIKQVAQGLQKIFHSNACGPFLNNDFVHIIHKGLANNGKRTLCISRLENHQLYQNYTFLPQWKTYSFENYWKYYN